MIIKPGPWSAGWWGDPDEEGKDDAAPFGIVSFNHGLVCDFPHPKESKHRTEYGPWFYDTWEEIESVAKRICDAVNGVEGASSPETP